MTRRARTIAQRARWLIAVALLVGGARAAHASQPRLHLERVDARACSTRGLLFVYLSELELEGTLRQRPDSEYRLLDEHDKVLSPRARSAKSFADLGEPLYMALVVENSSSYCKSLGRIRSALGELLDSLPARSRVTLISYADEARRLTVRAAKARAKAMLEQLSCETDTVQPALVDALDLALRALSKAPAGSRRLITGVSDGINNVASWNVFRAVGSRAASAGVPISFVGYSPIDERGPLLNLGELAKRSNGTLRWAKTRERLSGELRNLGHEIGAQRVLTFDVPKARCGQLRTVRVRGGALTSKALPVGPTRGGDGAGSGSGATGGAADTRGKSSGVVRVVLVVGGVVLLLGLLLLATRLLLRK
ncbi:MAG: VWA domain-containing protein [Myxococcales bacterium]|nr:VWA domain-containing protein [Myxococcales bacterium]